MIGLEIDLKKMLRAGRVITVAAVVQILGVSRSAWDSSGCWVFRSAAVNWTAFIWPSPRR